MRTHTLLLALLAVTGAAAAQAPELLDPALLAPIRWRSVGPVSTGGRVDDFAVARVPGEPDQIYIATASGGVFKSTNGGTSWAPVFDGVNAMMSVGDVTVAPSNTKIVWVGTGEANKRQISSWSDGAYKSVDAGKNWKFMGLKETRHIARIVIDPGNYEVVYVGAAPAIRRPRTATSASPQYTRSRSSRSAVRARRLQPSSGRACPSHRSWQRTSGTPRSSSRSPSCR